MNGFFIKDSFGSALEMQILKNEKELVISIINEDSTNTQINITAVEDLHAFQDKLRDLTWRLEDLINPRPENIVQDEVSEVKNG